MEELNESVRKNTAYNDNCNYTKLNMVGFPSQHDQIMETQAIPPKGKKKSWRHLSLKSRNARVLFLARYILWYYNQRKRSERTSACKVVNAVSSEQCTLSKIKYSGQKSRWTCSAGLLPTNKFILWWRLCSNMCAVDRSDNILKTGFSCILHFDVSLFNCWVWKYDIPGWPLDNSIPHSCDGLAEGQLAQSRLISLFSLCVLAVSHSKCGHSSIHTSMRIAIGNLKQLNSQQLSLSQKNPLSF